MAFSSGTFSLVAGNPVVTSTTISSTVMNNTLSDIATGLTTAILKDGTQTTTASIPFAEGLSVGAGKPGGAATQTDQETGSSTTVWVTPGRQQYHPSAAKCWGEITMSAGTPTLAASFNVTSITDTGTGVVTVTIATDFSSANYAIIATVQRAANRIVMVSAKAAGTFELTITDGTSVTDDYVSVSFVCFGDQA